MPGVLCVRTWTPLTVPHKKTRERKRKAGRRKGAESGKLSVLEILKNVFMTEGVARRVTKGHFW